MENFQNRRLDMNDWRLTGQEEYLFNVELKKINRKEIKNRLYK